MKKLLIAFCLFASCLGSCNLGSKADKELLSSDTSAGQIYLSLAQDGKALNGKQMKRLNEGWELADTPMLIESLNFGRDSSVVVMLYGLLKEKSGKNFELGSDEWWKWLWSQQYKEHPDYAAFKASIYRTIDPRFEAYFDDSPESTIRLDEIRWGGVRQDGIPPLRNPHMISANKADYLADTDVVFGIEVDGDFRAYPKRILAWHEMFTDTIQGVPLAGVY